MKPLEERDYHKDAVKVGNEAAKDSDKLLLSDVSEMLPDSYLEECLDRAYSSTGGGLRPEDGADIVAFDLSKRIEVLVRWIKGNSR